MASIVRFGKGVGELLGVRAVDADAHHRSLDEQRHLVLVRRILGSRPRCCTHLVVGARRQWQQALPSEQLCSALPTEYYRRGSAKERRHLAVFVKGVLSV